MGANAAAKAGWIEPELCIRDMAKWRSLVSSAKVLEDSDEIGSYGSEVRK